MSNLKYLTPVQLAEARADTLRYIERMELENEITNNPRSIERRKQKINGQRQRLAWINFYIGEKKTFVDIPKED